MKKLLSVIALGAALAQPAFAIKPCDFTPTKLAHAGAKGVAALGVGASAGVAAATGGALQAAGYYTIANATTGALMLGSTAAGASGAGTVGIMAGTAGLVGTAAAVVMSPVVIGVGVVAVGGAALLEGTCRVLR